MRRRGRYRGPGYVQCFSRFYLKNGKLKEYKMYVPMFSVEDL